MLRRVAIWSLLAGTVLAVDFRISCAEETSAPPRRLRVLSYNIHHGEGVDGRLNLERIAAVIRAAEPDIVALQEVDNCTGRTGGVDQAGELARLTGLSVVFGRSIRLLGGEYGNAVLSRYPIRSHAVHPLPNPAGGEARSLLEVQVALQLSNPDSPSEMPPEEDAGPCLTFLATHLDHTPNPRNRLAAAMAINEKAQAAAGSALLLVGDVNAVVGSPTLQELGRVWTVAGNGKVFPTVPVHQPRRQIDFVLFRPADRWKTIEVKVLDESVASDHRPLLVVLEQTRPSTAEVGD